ncbi:hypothetical protein ACET8O_20415 [Aeromonas veronii]
MNNHEEISLMELRQVGFPMTKAMRVTCSNGHLFLALDDHPKGAAGDYHCPHCDQVRIAAAVSASNRLQDQRDKLAGHVSNLELSVMSCQQEYQDLAFQLEDATRQCAMLADLVKESEQAAKEAFTLAADRHDVEECERWNAFIERIKSLQSGKDDAWTDKGQQAITASDYRTLQADHDYLKTLLHRRGFNTLMALANTLEKPFNSLAIHMPDFSTAVSTNTLRALASEMLTLPADHTGLSPIEGDQLPALGETVHIHLSSVNGWKPYRVVGFYAWADLGGDKGLHRVFVRLISATGTKNCRLLCDVRRNYEAPAEVAQ